MKKPVAASIVAGLALMGAAGVVYAATASPFGQFGSYEKVELIVEKSPIPDRGVIIEGQLYVPIEPLRQKNKLAYYLDGNAYQAHLFLGGGPTTSSGGNVQGSGSSDSSRNVEPDFMMNIPYDTKNYHAGMMRQDVINIATLSKALLETSRDLENAVYSKLTFNQEPNFDLLYQRLSYRSAPFEFMEDRMEALANELGNQKGLGSKWERRMDDVIDDLEDAVTYKRRALEALEDWMRYSDKDDLDDFREYEKDARKSIGDALKILIGEDIDNPGRKYSSNLKDEIDEWTQKVQKR